MLIVFASNFLNHHQLPLCLAFSKMAGVDFKFLAFAPTPLDRIKMGYEDMNSRYPFVVMAYESPSSQDRALKLISEADIFISGISDSHLRIRMKEGKRSYRFSESFFKTYGKKDLKHSIFHFFLSAVKHILPFNGKDVVYLAASSNLSSDLNRFFKCRNTILRWGYFPEHIKKEAIFKESDKDGCLRFLFAGRLLGWKHPDAVLTAFASLPSNILERSSLRFVGDGPLKEQLVTKAKTLDVLDKVTFVGNVAHNKVRDYMDESDIFLFSSDESEGWGAVLNEAMDSGCACIASNEAGSSRYLIRDRENGLLYSAYDQKSLNNLLLELCLNSSLIKKLQNNAYRSIDEIWNADVAAKRLVEYDRNGIPFGKGPCSLERSKL